MTWNLFRWITMATFYGRLLEYKAEHCDTSTSTPTPSNEDTSHQILPTHQQKKTSKSMIEKPR